LLKHSHNLNQYTELAVTKLDVLTGLPVLKICTGYELDGQIINEFPTADDVLKRCKPVYLEMSGWTEDITDVKSYEQLPMQAKNYIEKIEQLLGVKVKHVSVGPERTQTCIRSAL